MQTAAGIGCRAPTLASLKRDSTRPVRATFLLQPRVVLPASRNLRAVASSQTQEKPTTQPISQQVDEQQRLARKQRRDTEQAVYKGSAIAASTLVLSVAIFATYFRILWYLQDAGEFPYVDLAATLLLVLGGMVGMEMYARWAHKAVWHDMPLGWALHKSHHEPRLGPFEANDIYAVANALPAMALCLYGALTPNLAGSMCFGAGLGITLFGISYVFVHDGMVHRRFPVGPLADMPYFKRITLAHQLHHSEKYGGVPFGLFLGPQELEAVGAGPELDRMVAEFGQKKKTQAQ